MYIIKVLTNNFQISCHSGLGFAVMLGIFFISVSNVIEKTHKIAGKSLEIPNTPLIQYTTMQFHRLKNANHCMPGIWQGHDYYGTSLVSILAHYRLNPQYYKCT